MNSDSKTPGALYVGDLHSDVLESTLYEKFRDQGPITSIRICRDPKTLKSLGYGYVNFQNYEDAARVIRTMKFETIDGKPMRLMWPQRDPYLGKQSTANVFVKNLDRRIDNRMLHSIFSTFGNILSSKVVLDGDNQSKGFGFVQYETSEAAQDAIQYLNGKYLYCKKLHVCLFVPREKRTEFQGDSTNVYVGNLNEDTTDEELANYFEALGKIISVKVLKNERGHCRGIAFLRFKNPEDADVAITVLNGTVFKGRTLTVQRARTKEEKEQIAKELADKQNNNRNFTKVYIRHIPHDFDEFQVKELFETVGPICNIDMISDDESSDSSKYVGIITFVNSDDVLKAVAEFNGKILKRNILRVVPF